MAPYLNFIIMNLFTVITLIIIILLSTHLINWMWRSIAKYTNDEDVLVTLGVIASALYGGAIFYVLNI